MVVHDMAAGIARAGFQKLVLMNWHGGNSHLMGVLRTRYPHPPSPAHLSDRYCQHLYGAWL